jgi:hypothetical protein
MMVRNRKKALRASLDQPSVISAKGGARIQQLRACSVIVTTVDHAENKACNYVKHYVRN